MSYGKWKALHPPIEVIDVPKEILRPCKVCGGEIPPYEHGHKLYCSPECYRVEMNEKAKARYHRNKERMMANGKI